MNVYGLIGVLCGIFVGLVVCAITFKLGNTNGKLKTEYDERQIAVRGEGYKIGFYTYMIGTAVMVVLHISEVNVPMVLAAQFFVLMFVGAIPMCVYSIWNNAYWGLNNKKKNYMIFFAVAAIINIAAAVMSWIDGEMIVDGILTIRFMNLLCGLLFFVVGATLFVKKYVDGEVEEAEEAEE